MQFLSMKLASVNPMLYDFTMDLDSLMVRPEVKYLKTQWFTCTFYVLSYYQYELCPFDSNFLSFENVQKPNSLQSPPLSSVPQCSLNQSTTFIDTTTVTAPATASFPPANDYPLDNSASFFLQGQRFSVLSEVYLRW